MAEELKSRGEVDVKLTWDLSLIYKTEEEMWKDLDELKKLSSEIKEKYKGNLNTVDNIIACLGEYEKVLVIIDHAANYAQLAVEVDYYNNENQANEAKANAIIANVMSELSFIESEIAANEEGLLNKAIEKAESSKNYLKDILAGKAHLLAPEAERVLAAFSHTFEAPYEIYNNIKLADMQFENFEVDGNSYPLGYSLFEDDYEYNPDTKVRRAAFEAFSKKLKAYENSTATAYNAYVTKEKTMAHLRGFSSSEEMHLFNDKVTLEMYNRQIDLITKYLAPHMRKYARVLKKIHKLDKMTYADLKLPVDPGYAPDVTIEAARKYVESGLSILGEDYIDMVKEAFNNRWIDFAKNKGKCTGGFCASPYQRKSFILLSWNGKMSDVFTLAHELGHAGHFKLSGENRSIYDMNMTTYFVESPSTMNELLMAHYMLKTSDDKRFRRWVLSNMVGNTYYHNFVTHLLEAAYQREVIKIVNEGGSVQAETLSDIFKKVLSDFWGEEVELCEGAELTWMRQPHYYMGLYSYSYSAGLTIATQMCKRIENEGASAVEDWKKVLRAGTTLTPMELAKLGGVDISTDAALMDTIEIIGGYIDEIEKLTEELEG